MVSFDRLANRPWSAHRDHASLRWNCHRNAGALPDCARSAPTWCGSKCCNTVRYCRWGWWNAADFSWRPQVGTGCSGPARNLPRMGSALLIFSNT